MVEGVVVVSELGALVVEVDLLIAVELALELVRDLGGGDTVPEVVDLVLDLCDFFSDTTTAMGKCRQDGSKPGLFVLLVRPRVRSPREVSLEGSCTGRCTGTRGTTRGAARWHGP